MILKKLSDVAKINLKDGNVISDKIFAALLTENSINVESKEELGKLFPDFNKDSAFPNFKEFLESKYCNTLTNTDLFVNEIKKYDKSKAICILGDYDADGILATVIMVHTLKLLGFTVYFNIPDRLNDGYGDQEKCLEGFITDKNVGLFITVDNGISGSSLSTKIRQLGADLLITDHHLPSENTPKDRVIIDPKYTDDEFSDISGAYVALKLCFALYREFDIPFDEPLGVLAGITTISDMMPMLNENRILVKITLNALAYERDCYNIELEKAKAEAAESQLANNEETSKKLDVSYYSPIYNLVKSLVKFNPLNFKLNFPTEDLLGYQLGPAINSVSRVNGTVNNIVNEILNCLEIENYNPEFFYDVNEVRKENSDKMLDDLPDLSDGEHKVLIVNYDQSKYDFNITGIKGLIANNISSKYYKPSLVGFDNGEGYMDFSGRSIPGYALHEAVFDRIAKVHPEYGIDGGGHKLAIGVRFKREYLDQFQKDLDEDFEKYSNVKDKVVFEYEPGLKKTIIQKLGVYQPYGTGFQKLQFLFRGTLISFREKSRVAYLKDINSEDVLRVRMYLTKDEVENIEALINEQTMYELILVPSFESALYDFTIKN